MMYWIRYAMLAVSVFLLVYVALSIVLAGAWYGLKRLRLLESAAALFTLRILPLAGALLVVVLVTIPSFWSLEPSGTDEGVSLPAALLFGAGAAWLASRGVTIFASFRQASKFFALASPSMQPLDVASPISAYELPVDGPNLFLAGLWRPRLLISRGAMEMLDAQEMKAAIRHELAHAQSRDNIKQLVVRFCAFPLLASLDREWSRAAEVAADDNAVTDELGAADLASALIKVGTASARLQVPELGMSLVPEADAPVSARVQRLLDWKPNHRRGGHSAQLCLLLFPAGIVAFNLVWLMTQMHRFTEILFQ
jgi:Zn-dependent protease with chaperone function